MEYVYLMSLAVKFIPKGSIVLNINKEKNSYRDIDSGDIVVDYSYRSKKYTMILGFNFEQWYIKEIVGDLDDRFYDGEENTDDRFISERQEKLKDIDKTMNGGGTKVTKDDDYNTKKDKEQLKSDMEELAINNIDNEKEKGYLGSLVGSGLGIVLENKDIVLGCAEGNVTSLEKRSKICIIAKEYEKGNQLAQELFLTVEDIDGGNKDSIKLDVDYGFSPNIGLYDFTGRGYFDILISMKSGGSGGYYFYYIYTYINRKFVKIFDWMEFNKNNQFDVKYLDDMKVLVSGGSLTGEFLIDISQKDKAYLDSLYDSKGKLRTPTTGSASGVVNLYPVSINNNRKFELHIICNVLGVVTMDILGGVVYIEKWGKTEFEPLGERVILFGNTTYDNYGLSKIDPNYNFTPYDQIEANKNKNQ